MKIFNSLSGKKEDFEPLGKEVRMYVCGVNPYSDAHIGHAMSYIVFDVVRRYLEFRGYKVKHVENVTDVEDNIIATANRLGIPVKELTDKYTERYFEDMDNLNILRAHVYPRATQEIPKMLEVIGGLVDKGYAYPAGGSVYFRVRQDTDYGKLSRRTLEQMMPGACAETDKEKEDPMDFVLWKAAKPDEPTWDSPWGPGRPGWHIECSAMSLRYLGEQIDIHGGGQDLVFPHHENEIAQSESFTGKPFVKYWMHNGLLQMGADKMSKSLGNLITIRDALKKYSADALRLFILSSYYRSPLTYTEEAVEAAQRGADRLRRALDNELLSRTAKSESDEVEVYYSVKDIRKAFKEAMDDDFSTAKTLKWLFALASDINRGFSLGEADRVREHQDLLRELGGVLGLTFKEAEAEAVDPELETRVNKLIVERAAARKDKDWARADEIRDELNGLGVVLEDTPQGTIWKLKR